MAEKYTLIGTINLFDVIPDFVFPVFEYQGKWYFQDGENNKINKFVEVKQNVYSKVIPIKKELRGKIVIDIKSAPIYSFQATNDTIINGDVKQLYSYFQTYNTQDCILQNEILQFYHEVSMYVPKHENKYLPRSFYYYGTGRRKSSVARVRVYEHGRGKITINSRDIDDYFGLDTLKFIVRQPLVVTRTLGTVDIECTVAGGGVSGQAGAIRHGISRALLKLNPEFRPILKSAGFLTRDPRMKERKKYGLKAARRAPQFTKR